MHLDKQGIELNLDVHNASFAESMRIQLDEIIVNDCIRIIPLQHLKTKKILKQFSRWLSY